jgi:cellulose biosynthesis protein BcsQ
MSMIIMANTKGGSGKSTSSVQLIAPWVYSRLGSAFVLELDDQNNDTADFTQSLIKMEQKPLGQESIAHQAVEDLIEQAMDELIIVDLGGNRTCDIAMSQLSAQNAATEIDMIVIPVSSTGKDVDNAYKTLNIVREKMPRYKGPIVLVITRAPVVDLVSLSREYADAFSLAEDEGLIGPIILPQDMAFSSSRKLGKTAWEISKLEDVLRDELDEAKAASYKARNKEQFRTVSRLNAIVTSCVEMGGYLEEQFLKLDSILDLKKVGNRHEEPVKAKTKTVKSTEKDTGDGI